MDSILFNAILAMDSYNRGYGAAIDIRPRDAEGNLILDSGGNPLESDGSGIKIGNATIVLNSTVALGDGVDQSASFYAIAYQMPNDGEWNGQTIISYRGTDSATDGLAYPIGGGLTAGIDQAYMAFQFYNAVAKNLNGNIPIDPLSANISLTGHSLGGGLAGLVGVNDNHCAIKSKVA